MREFQGFVVILILVCLGPSSHALAGRKPNRAISVSPELGFRYLVQGNRDTSLGPNPTDIGQGEFQTTLWYRDTLGFYIVNALGTGSGRSLVHGVGFKLKLLTLKQIIGVSGIDAISFILGADYSGLALLSSAQKYQGYGAMLRWGAGLEWHTFSSVFIDTTLTGFNFSQRLFLAPLLAVGIQL